MDDRDLVSASEHPPFPRVHLTHVGVAWGVLALASSSFFLAVPQSAWHETFLPLRGRLGLLGIELIAASVFAFLVSIPSALADTRRCRSATPRRAGRLAPWLLRVWHTLACGALVASWFVFRGTGRFLDLSTLRLSVANPIQLLRHVVHMEPWTLLLFPILVFALGALLTRTLRWARELTPHVNGVIAVLLLFLIMSGGMYWVGSETTNRQFFITSGMERTGPLTSAMTEVYRSFRYRDDPIHTVGMAAHDFERRIGMHRYIDTLGMAPGRRWNVIVLLIESLRSDQLRQYGSERTVMPNVERLSQRSRVFLNHRSQASHSDYADMAALSSHYPLRDARYHVYPEDPTYPRVLIHDVLDALAYRTAVFSSQNEHWSGMLNYLDTGGLDRILHSDNYEGPTYVPRHDEGFMTFVKGTKRAGKIDDRYTVSEAIRWIEEEPAAPFFIYMNLQNSHMPYELPADFQPRFGTGQVSFPLRFGYFPPDSVAAVRDLYANSLAYVDAQVGKLLEYLEASGQWDNTLFVLTGDTGQGFYEHGFTGHGGPLYDEVMRVPLLVHAPGLAPGTDNRPAQHVDIPPTLFDLLGLPQHPSFQGRSLLGAEVHPTRPSFMVAQASADQYAVVSEGYKLIYDAAAGRHVLYDVVSDPGETRDLASSRTDLVTELGQLLHAWRKIQLDYYDDPAAQKRWYPPVLDERMWVSLSLRDEP